MVRINATSPASPGRLAGCRRRGWPGSLGRPRPAQPPPPGTNDPSPTSSAVYRHPAAGDPATGERLTLRWTGDVPQIVARPGDSVTSVLTVGQHVYAIPAEAKPYLAQPLIAACST